MAAGRLWLTRIAPAALPLTRAIEAAALVAAATLLVRYAWSIALTPRIDSDSGTALSASLGLIQGDIDALAGRLFPPLEIAVYGLLLKLQWFDAIEATPVVASLLLAASLSYAAYRHSGSPVAALVPLAVLCFSQVFWQQMGWLPFYPAFTLLGYAGIYAAGTFMLDETASWRWALAAAALLTLALCAFTISLLFLPVPALLLLCYWSRRRFSRATLVYACTGLLSAPWFIWHVAVAGEHFWHHPYHWAGVKYLGIINDEVWNYPHESFIDYMPEMLRIGGLGLLPPLAWPAVLLGLTAVYRSYGARALAFTLLSAGFFIAVIAVTRPTPFERYFYPVLPLTVMLASAGVFMLWLQLVENRHAHLLLATAVLALLVLAPAVQFLPGAVERYQDRYSASLTSGAYQDYLLMRQAIDDDKSIISRDSRGQLVLADNRIKTLVFLSEADYVTYLTWPSDAAVLDVLRRNNIGWVMLYKNAEFWEGAYNDAWLSEPYGKPARHYVEVPRSRASARWSTVKAMPCTRSLPTMRSASSRQPPLEVQ